jgi:thiamine-phosphate pyrophosphorylase
MSGAERFPVDLLRERLRIYLVADPEATDDLIDATQASLDGGATCVQLRAKNLGGYDFWRRSMTLKRLCEEYGALFIVNDRLDVALACGADGVHVGVSDLPVDVVRGMVPPGFIIGFSPQSDDDVTAAAPLGADYVGLGPVYATGSKADAGPPLGLDGLARQVARCRVPAVGIGGITIDNAAAVMAAGAEGVAVISAILKAPDPAEATRLLERAVNGGA